MDFQISLVLSLTSFFARLVVVYHFVDSPLILLTHAYQIYLTICKPSTTLICVILFLPLWMLPDHQF
jgi:hypothetical protein